MQMSNWVAAAEGGSREYDPVSRNPLDQVYQRSKGAARSAYFQKLEAERSAQRSGAVAPAGSFMAARHGPGSGRTVGMVLGSDHDVKMETSSSVIGVTAALPREELDLLQTVPKLRDTTLDGAHRASMTEGHFLSIWDPFVSQHRIRSASYVSASMLRDASHRHARSQYHPDEKYVLPPTVQNEIGWGLDLEKYKQSCSKFQDGAEFHGRTGSHITKFSERLLLGARHHLSGPMTNPKLHY